MHITLMGIGISSAVGAIDVATGEIPEIKRDLINLPNGVALTSQDAARLAGLAIGGAVNIGELFYSEIPLAMKTVKKLTGV